MLDLHGLTKEEIDEFRKRSADIVNERERYVYVIFDELSEYPPKQEPILKPKPDYVKFHSRWGQ